jgi:hypothetical protein
MSDYGFCKTDERGVIVGHRAAIWPQAAVIVRTRAARSPGAQIVSPRRISATKNSLRSGDPYASSCASKSIWSMTTRYRPISRRCSVRLSLVSGLPSPTSGDLATCSIPAPTRLSGPPTIKSGWIDSAMPETASGANRFGGSLSGNPRRPKAFSALRNNSMISAQRRASSRLFGVSAAESALASNALLTCSSMFWGRRASQWYARSARMASWLAVTIGDRVKRESCRMLSCLSARRIKYFASATADIRGSGCSRTLG